MKACNPSRLCGIIAFVAYLILCSVPTIAVAEPIDREEINEIIEDYLVGHPEVLYEALNNMQTWQALSEERRLDQAVMSVWDEIASSETLPYSGPSEAIVTIIEFFDYHCGYCKQAFESMKEQAARADGKVRVVFAEFPILREESETAARAALAADRQGKYLELHEMFMENRGALDQARIDELATQAGLDIDQLHVDMKSDDNEKMLDQVKEWASEIGITGTPAFLINGKFVGGANLKKINSLIDEGLREN